MKDHLATAFRDDVQLADVCNVGSVYGLTNQAGALVGSQGYDVFGAPTPAPSGPAGQPFGFTGREHELDSGLVYARNRYFRPADGRFLTPDLDTQGGSKSGAVVETGVAKVFGGVLPDLGQGSAGYGYASGNPSRFVDPTGFLDVDFTNRGVVLYTGFSLTGAGPWGQTGGYGAVFGLFGDTNTMEGFSSATATTYGFAFHGHYKLSFTASVDFGMYWGLKTACDYAGPFATGGWGWALGGALNPPGAGVNLFVSLRLCETETRGG